MAELVAEDAEPRLRCHGEFVNLYVLNSQRIAAAGAEPSLLRVDVARDPALMLPGTRVQQEYIVHEAVLVAVVLREVDAALHGRAGLLHRIREVHVAPVRIVRPVPRRFARKRHRRAQHELERLLPVLPVEIRLRLRHQPLLLRPRTRELPVLELNRNHHHAENKRKQQQIHTPKLRIIQENAYLCHAFRKSFKGFGAMGSGPAPD